LLATGGLAVYRAQESFGLPLQGQIATRSGRVASAAAGVSPGPQPPAGHSAWCLRAGYGATCVAVIAVGGSLARSSRAVQRRAAASEEKKEAAPAKAEAAAESAKTPQAAPPVTLPRPKAPAKKAKVPFDPSKQAGATEPFGFWDPLDLCPKDNAAFRKYRVSELKHGRVAMMASVGTVAQHFIRFPGGAFDETPAGIGAIFTGEGSIGLSVLFWVCLVFEFVIWGQDPNKEVGDFGDPFGVGYYDLEWRNREINNGRMAMFATVGILVAEIATGKDAVEQLGLGL